MDERKTSVGQGAKLCTNCGEVLQRIAERVSLHGDCRGIWSLLMEDIEMDVYACPDCGKLEFYRPAAASPEPEELVTCPACGAQHSKYINCPNCIMSTGFSQIGKKAWQQNNHEKQEKKKRKQDPWDWK